MIGAYVGFTLVLTAMSQIGVLPIWVVLLGAMIGAGIMGIIVELVAFRPLGRQQLHITPLITTIAAGFVLQEAAVKIFATEQRGFPIQMLNGLKQYDLQLGNFKLTFIQMFICIGASLDPHDRAVFLRRKNQNGPGHACLRRNTLTARFFGVNVHWVTVWTFGISSALAGAAGVLMAWRITSRRSMGGALGLKGLTIMLFGGSGNIVGAMVAALILGMIETMIVAYLVPAWKDGFAFGILILVLLYKPSGLFGSRLQIEAGR